jgi:UDP-N-acetylglucosamine acyltransferase
MNNIHPTAIIYPNVELGKNVTIGAYCVIGGPPEYSDVFNIQEPTRNTYYSVVIGDNTVIRDHVTINHGTTPDDAGIQHTRIGNWCYIMSHSHIGHDCRIGDLCVLHSGSIIGGFTTINRESRIGLNASIHPKSYLHEGTMLGAQAFFKGTTHETYRIYAGVPAIDIGPNVRGIERTHFKPIQ